MSQPPHCLPPALIFLGVCPSYPLPRPPASLSIPWGEWVRGTGVLSQRDGGRGLRCKFEGGRTGEGVCTPDPGRQGLGEAAESRPPRVPPRVQETDQILGVEGWGGEPKRETRAATGDPGVRSGGTWGTRENQAGLRGVGGMSRSGGSSTPWGVTPLLNPSPDFSPFPHPDSLNVTDNGSYW